MITQQVVDLVVVDLRATMQHVHLVLAQNHETASDDKCIVKVYLDRCGKPVKLHAVM